MELRSADNTPPVSSSFFREHRWIIGLKVLVDIIALQISLAAGFYVRLAFYNYWPTTVSADQYSSLFLLILFLPLGFWFMKLYPGYGLSLVERFRRKVYGTIVFFIFLTAWGFFSAEMLWSRSVFLSALFFALILPSLFQSILRYFLIKYNMWGTPVVVLGAGMTGRAIVSSLEKDPTLGLRTIGIFDDDRRLWGSTIEGIPIIGGIEEANVFSDVAQYVIIAIPGAGREKIVRLAEFLPFPKVLIVPDLHGLQSLWIEVRDLGGIPGMEIQRQLLVTRNRIIKRCVDYIMTVPLFLLTLPVLLFSAICIRISSPGSPFFTQEREGANGETVRIFKLRTMYLDAEEQLEKHLAENVQAREEWQQFFKLKNDPRILPFIGNILRKTSLDELPQFWNVLRGDISLVGPRPFPFYHLDQFPEEFRHLRRKVQPGLTGLWQVSARSDGDISVQERLDTYYIRNWSVWLDILIIAKTVRIVLTGKGAY